MPGSSSNYVKIVDIVKHLEGCPELDITCGRKTKNVLLTYNHFEILLR